MEKIQILNLRQKQLRYHTTETTTTYSNLPKMRTIGGTVVYAKRDTDCSSGGSRSNYSAISSAQQLFNVEVPFDVIAAIQRIIKSTTTATTTSSTTAATAAVSAKTATAAAVAEKTTTVTATIEAVSTTTAATETTRTAAATIIAAHSRYASRLLLRLLPLLYLLCCYSGSTNALKCYETTEGDLQLVESAQFAYCVLVPPVVRAGVRVVNSSRFGLAPENEAVHKYDRLFRAAGENYQILAACIFERFQFSTGVGDAYREHMFRCLCNFDFCNHETTFDEYLNYLKQSRPHTASSDDADSSSSSNADSSENGGSDSVNNNSRNNSNSHSDRGGENSIHSYGNPESIHSGGGNRNRNSNASSGKSSAATNSYTYMNDNNDSKSSSGGSSSDSYSYISVNLDGNSSEENGNSYIHNNNKDHSNGQNIQSHSNKHLMSYYEPIKESYYQIPKHELPYQLLPYHPLTHQPLAYAHTNIHPQNHQLHQSLPYPPQQQQQPPPTNNLLVQYRPPPYHPLVEKPLPLETLPADDAIHQNHRNQPTKQAQLVYLLAASAANLPYSHSAQNNKMLIKYDLLV